MKQRARPDAVIRTGALLLCREAKGVIRLRIQTIQAKPRGLAPEGFQRDRSLPPPVGLKPAAACGGSRQAERRELQGAAESRDYVCSPEDEGRRSVGIAKEQLAATIAIPGSIGKPFGGALGQSPKPKEANFFWKNASWIVRNWPDGLGKYPHLRMVFRKL